MKQQAIRVGESLMAGFNVSVLDAHPMETTGEISAFWVLLERAMREAHMTPTALSKRADISWTMLQRYRTRGSSPRMNTVNRLAEALEIDPARLNHTPHSKLEKEAGETFRRLFAETGLKSIAPLAAALGSSPERVEELALGTASLTAGEMRRLMERIAGRNQVAARSSKAGDGGGSVRRKDVDTLLDSAAASSMDETDRVALAMLLRKRDVAALMSELGSLAEKPAKKRAKKA